MKKTLDNTGVANFQSELFQLTLAEQQFRISQIRINFIAFMLTYFDLHSNQIEQIGNMPDSFTSMLANAIATTWESGQPINFQKETLAKDDKPDVKDIIVSDANIPNPTDPNTTGDGPVTIFPLSIWIRYRVAT